MQSQMTPPLPSGSHVSWPYYPEEQRNGYRRYVEEPHYSQNIIHVQQGQSVRLPYQAGPVQVEKFMNFLFFTYMFIDFVIV